MDEGATGSVFFVFWSGVAGSGTIPGRDGEGRDLALNHQVRTLSTPLDDLLELARIDAGVLRFELHDAELDALITSCCAGFEADARSRRVRLQTRLRD